MGNPAGRARQSLTVRQPGRWLMLGLYALVIASWLIGRVVSERHWDGWLQALGAVSIALIVLGSVSMLLIRVRVGPSGVQPLNQWGRRRHLPWSEVHHFDFRGSRLELVTTDGQTVRLMSYGLFERRGARDVAQLEAYRWGRQQALGLA